MKAAAPYLYLAVLTAGATGYAVSAHARLVSSAAMAIGFASLVVWAVDRTAAVLRRARTAAKRHKAQGPA